jgi:hypothetical protein
MPLTGLRTIEFAGDQLAALTGFDHSLLPVADAHKLLVAESVTANEMVDAAGSS